VVPDKIGYLHKKSPALLKGWQKRYCELKDRKFKWFKLKKVSKKSKALEFESQLKRYQTYHKKSKSIGDIGLMNQNLSEVVEN